MSTAGEVQLELPPFEFSNVKSYFPIPPRPDQKINSTRVHLHIDAISHSQILEILDSTYKNYEPAKGQIKVYPINSLHLGPQVKKYPVYGQMMNFHEIKNTHDEAFVTGRLGDEFNTDFLLSALNAAKKRSTQNKRMVEIEEYIGEWKINSNGKVETVDEYSPLIVDKEPLRPFDSYLCHHIPPLELHHGFDIPKDSSTRPPIELSFLDNELTKAGLSIGGFFIFQNDQRWCYRTNEFSFQNQEKATIRLFDQAKSLHKILNEWGYSSIEVDFSLEIVHGIWHFDPELQ